MFRGIMGSKGVRLVASVGMSGNSIETFLRADFFYFLHVMLRFFFLKFFSLVPLQYRNFWVSMS